MNHTGAENICWCWFCQRRKNPHSFRRTQTCLVQTLKGEKEGKLYDTEASFSFEVKGSYIGRQSSKRGLVEAGGWVSPWFCFVFFYNLDRSPLSCLEDVVSFQLIKCCSRTNFYCVTWKKTGKKACSVLCCMSGFLPEFLSA